jgi:hypothetical protein
MEKRQRLRQRSDQHLPKPFFSASSSSQENDVNLKKLFFLRFNLLSGRENANSWKFERRKQILVKIAAWSGIISLPA